MHAKPSPILAMVAASMLAATPSIAQDQDDADAILLEQFERMHGVTAQFRATDDPTERQDFMREHMRLMQQMMDASAGVMVDHDATPHDGDPDSKSMQSQMGMMHQMMMQMMAQQDMMMTMMHGGESPEGEVEQGQHHE